MRPLCAANMCSLSFLNIFLSSEADAHFTTPERIGGRVIIDIRILYLMLYVCNFDFVFVWIEQIRPLSVQTQSSRAVLTEGSLSPRTRQQRDIDNALRHMKLVCMHHSIAGLIF